MILNTNPNKREELYDKYLKEISGINFTSREMDIIACILHNRGEKKIASLLGISYRTVGTHVRNIMGKLGYSSREYIIDAVEKSGKLQYLRQYYFHLVAQASFEKQLQKIGAIVNRSGVMSFIHFGNSNEREWELLKHLEQHLNLANITLINNEELNKNSKNTNEDNGDNKHNDDVLLNIYIVGEELNTSVKKDIGNDIILLIDKKSEKSDLSVFKDMNIVDFRDGSEYYFATFRLIEKLVYKDSLNQIIQEFKTEYDNLQKSWNGTAVTIEDDEFVTKPAFKIKKLLLIFVAACLIIGSSVFLYNKNKQPDIAKIRQDFITYSKSLIADSVTDKERKQGNYALIDQVEQTISYLNTDSVLAYYHSNLLQENDLLNCIYVMHALANHYTYNQHNGIKGRKILLDAKIIAEKYINNKNNLQINFADLKNEEIYTELSIVNDLPEMYTRILYSIGKSYLYQGNLQDSIPYFKNAQYLGNKLGIFEGYVSLLNGLEFVHNIEIEENIVNLQYAEAKKKILESIQILELLLRDNTEYKMNYIPGQSSYETIIPSKDKYNIVSIKEKLLKHYSRLILISNDQRQVKDYLGKISGLLFPADGSTGLIQLSREITPKMTAYLHNTLGNTLLKLHDKNINRKEFLYRVKDSLQETDDNIDVLHLAELSFNIGEQFSRNTDFTKADSYDGKIRVYNKMLDSKTISESKRHILKQNIESLTVKRDKINKDLNRGGWQLRYNQI